MKKKSCLTGLFWLAIGNLFAQTNVDSSKTLNGVVVTGIKTELLRYTPFNVTTLTMDRVRNSVNFSVADALAKMPGISQISTGVGISKPVIRGLYGNRIETVLLGLRFDNQQWQDEHGLGLSIIGIDRIEVLKGPSSLLYGTEAVGGVINIIEEKIADSNTKEADLNGSLYSNTYGLSLNGGIKENKGNKNWRIRLGMDNHADYMDGNNNRVLNSRFASYNLKASLGYVHRNWVNENNFYTSYSKFGFIMEDNQDRKPKDNRLSRTMNGPNHSVFFNILSSENSITLKDSKLQINGGVHSNLRLENEGGNRISLNMLLNTYTYNAKWAKPLSPANELILGNEGSFQTNRNYGSRVIIPDANLSENALSVYFRNKEKWVQFETGLSMNLRRITTYFTQNLDTSNNIQPFGRWYTSFNGNAGASFNLPDGWNIKINGSTGYRSPNLAELSSNGLHEGTFRYEIGNPGMKAEQNINTEVNLNYESKWIDVYSAVYLNNFRNYIYLSPIGTQLYGFDIYRFLQANAKLYGSELSVNVRPATEILFQSSIALVRGKLKRDKYLPFMPADKWTTDLTFVDQRLFTNAITRFRVGIVQVFKQDRPGDFETPTGSYWLLNAGMSLILHKPVRDIQLSLNGDNLLNEKYFDHLSRFKYYGIYNIGRNIQLSLSIPLFKNNMIQ